MNALVGQPLSIVTPKAQTTRHRLLGVLSEPLWQAAFLDTPGVIAERRDALEERMMAAVEEAARDADALLLVVDAADRPREALALVRPAAASALARGVRAAVALNKVDLLGWEEHDALVADFKEDAGADAVISVSAKQTLGLRELTAWVAAQLPESPALYARSDVAAAPERFFVAEIVRKHLFLTLHQELPYGMTAEVVEWKERRAPRKPRVSVVVFVEQERHKGMVVGAGGAGVKALGVAARAEAEAFLGREIFLDLAVKVAPKWRESKESVEARGY
jgi:GTP-binding protein Era